MRNTTGCFASCRHLKTQHPELRYARFADAARRRQSRWNASQPVRHAVPMLSIRTETDISDEGALAFDARVRARAGLSEPMRRSSMPAN